MNTATDYHTDAAKELEVQLEALCSLWSAVSTADLHILSSQILRWRETTRKIIRNRLGQDEERNFSKIADDLDPVSNSQDSLALVVKRLEAHLIALLDAVWVDPDMVIAPESDSAMTVGVVPESNTTGIRRWTYENIGTHPLRVILGTLLIAIPGSWFTAIEVRVKPLEFEIESLRHRIKPDTGESAAFSYSVTRGVDSDKTYLDKSPIDLWKDIERMTPVQAKAFVDNEYRGKWIVIRGPAYHIYESESLGTIEFNDGTVRTTIIMSNVQIVKLRNLYKGREVTVEGKFGEILDGAVSFTDGILIEP